MEIKYVDAHSHPHFSAFDNDREEVIQNMQQSGVAAIAVGTGAKTSKQAVDIAQEHDFIWTCVGQHPTEHEEFDENFYKELLQNKKENKIVAIGECGLDLYRMEEEDKERQIKLFETQIQLAVEADLPLMLHIRSAQNSTNAHDLAFDILKRYKKEFPKLHLHMHFFTANTETAKKFLELDATFGIPGVVTFAKSVQEMVEFLPTDKILVESDAPYAAPIPKRGQRNEPSFIIYTLEKIAEVKKLDNDFMQMQVLENTMKTFNLNLSE